MAAPSQVPSAAGLARLCVQAYRARYGAAADDLPPGADGDLESLTTHFFRRNELQTLFVTRLLSQYRQPFGRDPNQGHYAIADFLACGAVDFVLSTNVDVLVETAAASLGEPNPVAAISFDEVALQWEHRPHLKLHGCVGRNARETLWCTPQLDVQPFQSRIPDFREWVRQNIVGKTVIFVGFWSDWAYLNGAFEMALGTLERSTVVVVNPASINDLQTKAPALWQLAHTEAAEFHHIQQCGAAFLDELRAAYCRRFVEDAFAQGRTAFERMSAQPCPDYAPVLPENSEQLYELRRDLCGTPTNKIVRGKQPQDIGELVPATHLKLLAAGARIEGNRYILDGQRIRIIDGANQFLSTVIHRYRDEVPPVQPDTAVICVGAREDSAPDNIVRPDAPSTITRPASEARWITDQMLPLQLRGGASLC